jgi:hypothetical protein
LEPKFGIATIKPETFVVNVISPMCNGELHIELNMPNLACITTDIYNKNNIKAVPIIVCCFSPQAIIKVKLLDYVPGTIPEILINRCLSVIKEHELKKKISRGFCDDNYNVNVGGVKRKGWVGWGGG